MQDPANPTFGADPTPTETGCTIPAAGRRLPYEDLRSLSDLNVIEYRSCFTAGMECSHSRRAGPSST